MSTILKIPDIWERIKIILVEDSGNGTEYRLFLDFYMPEGQGYHKETIFHSYFIEDTFLIFNSANSDICIYDIKEKSLLEFKDKVKEFLFENEGFFRLANIRLFLKNFCNFPINF